MSTSAHVPGPMPVRYWQDIVCYTSIGDVMDSSECDVFNRHSYQYTHVAVVDG